MREYNLNEYTVVNAKGHQETTNTPAKSDKVFGLTLTSKQGKVLSEVKHFWNREIEFPELKEFWEKEMNFTNFKNTCKEVKDFWCEDISGVEEKYKYID